jgi:hypothetical protein
MYVCVWLGLEKRQFPKSFADYPTNSIGQSQSWEAGSRLATQEIPLLIWKWKTYT